MGLEERLWLSRGSTVTAGWSGRRFSLLEESAVNSLLRKGSRQR